MKILLTNFRFNVLSGSECWLYAMALEFKRQGHDVDLFITTKVSQTSPFLQNKLIKQMSIYSVNIPRKEYDIIFANHTITIKALLTYYKPSNIIQTCHGIYPPLEQPFRGIRGYISVSDEISHHLGKKGIKSRVIYNSVDCERFKPYKQINQKLTNVLSLVQDNKALGLIKKACTILKLNLKQYSKAHTSILNIEDEINNSDLVISIGRGVYEAMSCGRNVICFDCRGYYTRQPMGHGLLKSVNEIKESLLDNFTGRNEKKYMDLNSLINEMKQYSPVYGDICRKFVFENFNVQNAVEKYVNMTDNG
jgi:hypothetical protein